MSPETRDPRRDLAEFSDAELDAMAVITPEDIERAKAAFRRDARAPFKRLLDATPIKDPSAGS